MKGWKGSAVTILVLLLLLECSVVTVATAAEAEIVTDVTGFRNYVTGSNSFTHGNTLTVYTEMTDVNYEGFVFVEFVFIIEDPRGNIVSMDRMNIGRRDYDENAYVVYTKRIPSWWRYGKYKLDIYAYDRVNKANIRELEQRVEKTSNLEELLEDEDDFDDLKSFFEKGGEADDLGALRSFSDSEKEIAHIRFYVRHEAEIQAAEPSEGLRIQESAFAITNVGIDKFTVKPDEPVAISVTVENKGARATRNVSVVINGKTAVEEAVTLDAFASKTLRFTVTKDMPGTYKVTVPGTSIVRVFFVEEISEETGNSTASAPVPVTQQPEQRDGGGGGLFNSVFCLLVAFTVLFVTITGLLYLNSKQVSTVWEKPQKSWGRSKKSLKGSVSRTVDRTTLNFSRFYR